MKCKVLVEKFSANGELDRIKAHLAANGAQQDCLLYPKQSSSTASTNNPHQRPTGTYGLNSFTYTPLLLH
jgi:hypothetical protein